MEDSKAGQIIFLICGLILTLIYAISIKNDYYYIFSKKEAIAELTNIVKDNKHEPYVLTIRYYNNYTKEEVICIVRVNGRIGKKIVEKSRSNLLIYYTKKSICDIYMKGYQFRTLGSVIIHHIVFFILLWGIFRISKNIKSLNDKEKQIISDT